MEIPYIAGLIDGEGHISRIPLKNGRGQAHVYTRLIFVQHEKNNGEVICSALKEQFGGNVSYTLSNQMYRWQLQGAKADALISRLLPYFMVKHIQAQKALQG